MEIRRILAFEFVMCPYLSEEDIEHFGFGKMMIASCRYLEGEPPIVTDLLQTLADLWRRAKGCACKAWIKIQVIVWNESAKPALPDLFD